jgi:hypothetical protein
MEGRFFWDSSLFCFSSASLAFFARISSRRLCILLDVQPIRQRAALQLMGCGMVSGGGGVNGRTECVSLNCRTANPKAHVDGCRFGFWVRGMLTDVQYLRYLNSEVASLSNLLLFPPS